MSTEDLTGRINGYRCDTCNRVTYIVHVDHGVTPMFLACRASGSVHGCPGRGVSLMYPSADPPPYVREAVAWEWYRPSRRQRRRQDTATQEHLAMGGCLLRELTDAGRTLLEAA